MPKKFVTLYQLMNNTSKHFPDMVEKSHFVSLSSISIEKVPGTKTSYSISAVSSSEGKDKKDNKRYESVLWFYQVSEEDFDKSLMYLPVRVGCSCMAYYFYFIYPNSLVGANVGGSYFEKYERKTPKTDPRYPEKNPQKIPGLCKHLFRLASEYSREKLKNL